MKPSSPPGRAAPPPASPDADHLWLQFACPNCGGPFRASETTVSHQCEFCQSLLLVEAPSAEEIVIEPARVVKPAELLKTFVELRLDALRPRSEVDEHGREIPPGLIELARFKRIEKSLREKSRILGSELVWVPFEQTSGRIVQAVLGRRGEGAKEVSIRGYVAETTHAVYDAAKFNFRDKGLRSSSLAMRPIEKKDYEPPQRFIPRAANVEANPQLRRWTTQTLDANIDTIGRRAEIIPVWRALAYRPYFVVKLEADQGVQTVLFDGVHGAVSGYLADDEVKALHGVRKTDARKGLESHARHVRAIPSRCPNCGADQKLDEEALVSICLNCHAGIAPTPAGLEIRNYDREEQLHASKKVTLLPFWRFPFEITVEGKKAKSVEAYFDLVFPRPVDKPPGFAPKGEFLYVPAFPLLTTEAGDAAYLELTRFMQHQQWSWTSDRVDLHRRPRFVPATVPVEHARVVAFAALLCIHTKPSATRLNTLLLKTKLFEAPLTLGDPRLSLVGFADAENQIERPGAKLGKLLIDGGPKLLAQRVTVEKALSAVSGKARKPTALEAKFQADREAATRGRW